ncbi:MAG: 2-oxoglutarate dehydrogenase E1 component [Burkholderiales bacterium]|nr:2-oxoglutarate dehydrogenase E1 component [Burkholderiales bacterium]
MAVNGKLMQDKWKDSYLFGGNTDFIEELYDKYLENPANIEPKWKNYFDSIQDGVKPDIIQQQIKQKFAFITQHPALMGSQGEVSDIQTRVWRLIEAYRALGMTYADLDPLQRKCQPRPAVLDIATYGLQTELNNEFYVDLDLQSSPKFKLSEIVKRFDAIYCAKASFEFAHIADLTERAWLTSYVENKYLNFKLSSADKIQLLQKLTEADGLERYLNTKYVGQKRFSLEGGDSLIPALDRIIRTGSKNRIKEVYIGMAHRGRINTLVNIVGKAPQKIFDEFEGNYPAYDFVTSGDVKYHKGYKCNYITEYGTVKTVLAYNPSHLEIVNPVLNGMVRAVQDKVVNGEEILGVLIHGDSALIGLGTNQGVLNMSQTRGYSVRGMIHIVVNNQIGFTTSDVRDNRSSRFCTDIAKMVEAPIIHVNGDDPESIAFIMDLAIDYRLKYNKDIMIDLVCFRRHGHNEADDPSLTQPYMYRLIKQHPGPKKIYADKLIAEGIVDNKKVEAMAEEYRLALNKGMHVKGDTMHALKWYDTLNIEPILKATPFDKVSTAISDEIIQKVTEAVTTLPNNEFKPHPTVVRLIEARKAMGNGSQMVDFGMAEMFAYGSLLIEGVNIRMSGEDSCRGTFTHRHAVWHDLNCDDLADSAYTPLSALENKSRLHLYDSVLNEECVLGFEYGYGTINLRDLVIWEAQFGDFTNGAQVIIDQFIASGEAKWGTLGNIVLLLPHGYDGQGPEHSSARVERYLQLCAENNMQLVIPSTPAQMFHALRHKALTNWIKPLVIFMSKKLLRYKEAMSALKDFTDGEFKYVIADMVTTPNAAKTVIVCTGQVYYDFYNERAKRKLENEVAIVRLEQLYPFPKESLKQELARYNKAHKFIWCQEEPYNQGSWVQIRESLDDVLANGKRFTVAARPSSAAPACGLASMHNAQLSDLINRAFE